MNFLCRKSVSRDPYDDVIMKSLDRVLSYSDIDNSTIFDAQSAVSNIRTRCSKVDYFLSNGTR